MMSENYNIRKPFNKPRFNKFKSSLESQDNSHTPAKISGLKRPRIDDSPDFYNSKKICTGLNKSTGFQSPCTKNIANTRLQKIKEKLRNEVLQEATSPVLKNPKKTTSEENKVINEPSFSRTTFETPQTSYQNNLNTSQSPTSNQTFIKPNTPKNIYQNLDKWTSPPDSTHKNFANSRLQRLKQHVLTPPDKSSSPDNRSLLTGDKCLPISDKCDIVNNNDRIESPNLHRSPLLVGIKRTISDENTECSLPKRPAVNIENVSLICRPSSHIKSPELNVSKQISLQENDNQLEINKSPLYKNVKIIKKVHLQQNSMLSNDTLKDSDIAATSVEVNTESSVKSKSDNDTSDQNTNSFSNFKPPKPPLKPDKSFSISNAPSDSFSARMERTALWVKNTLSTNYDVEETPNTSKSADMDKPKEENIISAIEDTEEMEWTNAEPDEELVVKENSNSKKNPDNKTDVKQQKSITLCVVVDTNIFISSLAKLKDILAINIQGSSQLFIYIPWMVMEELDYMKDHCSSDGKLKKNIMKSIKFINEALNKEQRKVIGQTVEEASTQKHIGSSQDDKIISCCMQVSQKYENVILLSNDMNLRNKAMINDILVCSANEIIMKIMSKFVTSTKSKKILQKMSILCSSIICECAKETYGDVWSKMDLLSCPPWSLVDCLKRFRKYWNSVFKDKLMKQCTKTLDELTKFLQENVCVSDDSEDYIRFMKLCIKLCVFLKDIEDCRGSVEITIRDLSKIG